MLMRPEPGRATGPLASPLFLLPACRHPVSVAVSRRVIEVRFQRGVHLPELDLWLDPWEAKPHAFVSHAHADHFARHESVLCSDVTSVLLRRRYNLAEGRIDAQNAVNTRVK